MSERSERFSDRGEQVMRFLGEAWERGKNQRLDQEFANGFDVAANMAVEAISAKAEALKVRMTSGKGLSSAEQAVYAELDTLKTELHEAFFKWWQRDPKEEQA
jgi:hypothetical protein